MVKLNVKKKILFLSPLPPPHYGSALSSEMCLSILKNYPDFKVKNIKLNYSKEMSDVGRINIDKISGIFKVKKEIKKQVKYFNPDLIYFVPATSGFGLIRDYIFVRQIKKTGKNILFHVRSRISEKDRKNYFYNLMYRKMFFNERAIILGKELLEDVSSFVKKENIIILPNAIKNDVSDKEFKIIMDKRKKRKSFNIIFLSNMDKTKGWFKVLESCKIMNNHKKEFKAYFVGEWASKRNEEDFNNYVKQNNLEKKVYYLGKKTGKDKNEILSKSDILVFPTEYRLETFGRVIVEAMMFGLPVIANGVATIPSIIEHGKTGYVLKENTPTEIARYLMNITNKEIISMGLEGRKRFLEKFELKKYNKRFLEVINNCF